MMNAPRPARQLSELKAAWLKRLHRDYLNLLWRNGLAKMPPAALELMKDKNHWGRWDEEKRLILINESLIWNHPWEAALGILGHETAHQLISDIGGFEDRKEAPHGPAFQKMGRRLGLDPFYLKPSVELINDCPRPWLDPDLPPARSEGRAILEKVKKILALSASPVEAEALAAMNAAARIMARHNLDLLGREDQEEDFEYRRVRLPGGRLDTRLAMIAKIMTRHFFVQCVFVPDYDPQSDSESKALEVIGRPENARLAEHVFHFLMERSESLWQEYHYAHRGGGHTARNSFIVGLLEGFESKLSQAASTDAASASADGFSALVLARDQGLEQYFRRRHPRLRTASPGRNRRHCPKSGRAGRKAGKSLNLYSPLESGQQAGRPGKPLLIME